MSELINLPDFKELLEEDDTLIVFDTSALLHLFECAPNLTTKLLNNLGKVEGKLWMPNQVYNEYKRKKDIIKNREMNKFKNVSISYQQQLDKLESEYGKLTLRYKKYDFNGIEELEMSLKESVSGLKTKLQEYKNERNQDAEENRLLLIGQDIEQFVKGVVDSGKIGRAFTLEELLSIYQEGEVRFKYKIPPGYQDFIKDKNDDTKRKKFGDLIIWKEILREARCENKNIIFVLEDDKEDWWHIKDNQLMGPRNELVKEFRETISEDSFFFMLGTNQFNGLLSRMFEDNKAAIESFVEAECEDILINSILDENWVSLIDLDGSLLTRFIHDGELQHYLDNVLTNVEIEGCLDPEIEEINVEFFEEYFEIEARFSSEIEVIAYSSSSAEFSHSDEGLVTIVGKIKARYNIDYVQYIEDFVLENLCVDSISIKNMTIFNSEFQILGDIDDLMVCMDCYKPANYMHSNGKLVCDKCSTKYMVCPNCGMLFDELSGAFCDSCE